MKLLNVFISAFALLASALATAENPINNQSGYYKLNFLAGYADRKSQELKAHALIFDHMANKTIAAKDSPQAISYDLNSLGLTSQQLAVIKKVLPDFSIADQLSLCKIPYDGFDAAIYLPLDDANACNAKLSEKSSFLYAWKKSAAGNKIKISSVKKYQFENSVMPYKYTSQLEDVSTTDTRFRVKYTQGTLAQKQGLTFELNMLCKNCKDGDRKNDTHNIQQILKTGLGYENYSYSPFDINETGGEVYSFTKDSHKTYRLSIDKFRTDLSGKGYISESRSISTDKVQSWKNPITGEMDEHSIYEHNFNSQQNLVGESLNYCQIVELAENGYIRRYATKDGGRMVRNSNESCALIKDLGVSQSDVRVLISDLALAKIQTKSLKQAATDYLLKMNNISAAVSLGKGKKLTVEGAQREFEKFASVMKAGLGIE